MDSEEWIIRPSKACTKYRR